MPAIRAHGTQTRYKQGPDENNILGKGCRCRPCTDAAAKAMNLYRLRLAQTGPRLVDAQPVREHVLGLNAQGLPFTSIAVMAGVPYVVVSRLVGGQPGKGAAPTKRLRAENASALLAVRADSVGAEGRTLAVGTRRRLQALAWAGWPAPYVAPRIPLHPDYLKRLMRGQTGATVTAGTARNVAVVFKKLWDVDPVKAGVPAQKASQVRTLAARIGYVPAMAWDDIDDPREVPDLGEKVSRLSALGEDAEELVRVHGMTRSGAAERLGVSPGYVTEARRWHARRVEQEACS